MTRLLAPTIVALTCAQACNIGYEILDQRTVDPDETASGGFGGERAGGAGPGGTDGSGGAVNPQCDAWLEPNLIRRRRITFDNRAADGPLDDFTALVVLTAQTFNYEGAAPLGADLRFVDAETGAPLSHHVDTWNEGALSTIWVKVPRIDATAKDHIWMYYGGDEAAPQDAADTYDGETLAVWHLGEPSGPFRSSTSATIPLSWVGGGNGSRGAPGRIGAAIDLDGDADGANSAGGELDGLSEHTITLWAHPNTAPGGNPQQTLFSVEDDNGAPFAGPGLYFEESTSQIGTWVNGVYHFSGDPANQLVAGEWAFIAQRTHIDPTEGTIEMKVNGGNWELVFAGDTRSAATVPGSNIQIGNWIGPSDADFFGSIDEVQVSRGLRSDDWVDAQYRSQAHLGFITVGDEDTCDE